MNARPVLLLDLGWEVTGIAVATWHPVHGVHFALDAIRPAHGMSPKARNDKRASERFGEHAQRLFMGLTRTIARAAGRAGPLAHGGVDQLLVAAEVPTMGAINAGAMRSMAGALAVYHAALMHSRPGIMNIDVHRNDVVAAAFGHARPKLPAGEKKTDFMKRATRTRLIETFSIAAFEMSESLQSDRDAQEDAYDAAAVVFALRDSGVLANYSGWAES